MSSHSSRMLSSFLSSISDGMCSVSMGAKAENKLVLVMIQTGVQAMTTRGLQHAASAATCQPLMLLLLRLLRGRLLLNIPLLTLQAFIVTTRLLPSFIFTFTTRLPLRPIPLLAGVCMQYMLATTWCSVWSMLSCMAGLALRVASCTATSTRLCSDLKV